MRPKASFRENKKLQLHKSRVASWVGDFAKASDGSIIDPDLAEILQMQQAWLAAIDCLPAIPVIRVTLEKLLHLRGEQRAKAIRFVDSVTDAQLATGALRWHRKRTPQGDLPSNWLVIEAHPPHVQSEMIRHALDHLNEKVTTGRRHSMARDVAFIKMLEAYYSRTTGKKPTNSISRDGTPSSFLQFAQEHFLSVGRSVAARQIERIFRKSKMG